MLSSNTCYFRIKDGKGYFAWAVCWQIAVRNDSWNECTWKQKQYLFSRIYILKFLWSSQWIIHWKKGVNYLFLLEKSGKFNSVTEKHLRLPGINLFTHRLFSNPNFFIFGSQEANRMYFPSSHYDCHTDVLPNPFRHEWVYITDRKRQELQRLQLPNHFITQCRRTFFITHATKVWQSDTMKRSVAGINVGAIVGGNGEDIPPLGKKEVNL